MTPITPGFFRTMGIPHVMGRDFTTFDRGDSPPVAIVNETMVRLHLTDGNPIGKRLHVNAGFIERLDYEIVGVVGDVKLAALDRDIRPTVYLPHTQLAIPLMTLVVRTEMNPLSLAPVLARRCTHSTASCRSPTCAPCRKSWTRRSRALAP